MVNPFQADDRAAVERGAAVFATFCRAVPGRAARGWARPQHGFPAPPPLSRGQTQEDRRPDVPDPDERAERHAVMRIAISREDRWKAILHRAFDAPPRAGGRRQVIADSTPRVEQLALHAPG